MRIQQGLPRSIAEKMLHKITGIQLFAQESGPIQQLVVQLPCISLGKTSGRNHAMEWKKERKWTN